MLIQHVGSLILSLTQTRRGSTAYGFRTQETEAGGSEVQSNLWLHSECDATPQCMRLCLKDNEFKKSTLFLRISSLPGMVMHVFDPSTFKAEAGGSL